MKTKLLNFTLSLFIILSSTATNSSTTEIVFAEVNISDCAAELYINDIPIRKFKKNLAINSFLPISEYIIMNRNEIKVIINPGPTPSEADALNRTKSKCGNFEVSIVAKDMQDSSVQPVLLGQLSTDDNFKKNILTSSFSVKNLNERWSWEKSEQITLDNRTMNEITSKVISIHSTITNKRLQKFIAEFKVRIKDKSSAYPFYTVDEIKQMMITSLSEDPNNGIDLEFIPLQKNMFDFRLCANNRMVQIIDKNWEPSIRSKKVGNMDVQYNIFLSRINGEWIIVR